MVEDVLIGLLGQFLDFFGLFVSVRLDHSTDVDVHLAGCFFQEFEDVDLSGSLPMSRSLFEPCIGVFFESAHFLVAECLI